MRPTDRPAGGEAGAEMASDDGRGGNDPRPPVPLRRPSVHPGAAGLGRVRLATTEPRALGLPARLFKTPQKLDTRWLRHPIRWRRWRAEVRRLGPYAPDFRP